LVEELKRFAERLPEKYQYLTSAPAHDPDGLPAVVRFSRKEKEHYVRTEKEGKPSGWMAVYQEGKWLVTDKRKNAK